MERSSFDALKSVIVFAHIFSRLNTDYDFMGLENSLQLRTKSRVIYYLLKQ